MYTPLAPPSDPKALSAFLNGELQRIAQALNQRQDSFVRFTRHSTNRALATCSLPMARTMTPG